MMRRSWRIPAAALGAAALQSNGGGLSLEWQMPLDIGGAGKGCAVAEVLITQEQ
jgi:hypothetical protein